MFGVEIITRGDSVHEAQIELFIIYLVINNILDRIVNSSFDK